MMKANYRRLPALAVVLAGLALGGCAQNGLLGEGPAGLALVVEPLVTPAGREVTLRLHNRTQSDVGYNLCGAVLDRRVAGSWEEYAERPAEVCTMELRILQPGQSGEFTHTLPAALPAGTYRFRTGVEWPMSEGNVGVASTPFEVVG